MNIIKPMKTIASISTLCAIMALTGIASAEVPANDSVVDSPKQHHKKAGHSDKKMMKRMIKALSLTEEQQAQIKAIKEQEKEQSSTLKDSIKRFKEAEKLLIQAESFDEQAYVALHLANQQVLADLGLIRAKSKNAIFNVLNPEQQAKWQKIMENYKGKKGKSKKD